MSDNIIQLNQDLIHTELKDLVKNSVEETLNAMLDAEADKLVQAERYARDEQRQGYRAGHYDRSFATTAGEVNLSYLSSAYVSTEALSLLLQLHHHLVGVNTLRISGEVLYLRCLCQLTAHLLAYIHHR